MPLLAHFSINGTFRSAGPIARLGDINNGPVFPYNGLITGPRPTITLVEFTPLISIPSDPSNFFSVQVWQMNLSGSSQTNVFSFSTATTPMVRGVPLELPPVSITLAAGQTLISQCSQTGTPPVVQCPPNWPYYDIGVFVFYSGSLP